MPPSWPAIEHDVALALGDAGGDRADADLGHQLDADPGLAVGVFQVVDQLRQVFDRIDVMVRRRRDQTHARRAVPDAGDFLVDLVAGQLAPFARLGALRHLDLQFLRVDQVLAGHAEASAGHLLDGAIAAVAVGVELIAGRVFAPFAGVALGAQPIHGDRQRLVGFFRDRPVRHRARGKPFDDLGGRLDFVQRDRLLGLFEFQQAAEREQLPLLLVDQLAVFVELFATVQPRGVLQLGHHLGVEEVGFSLAAPLVLAADVEIERLGHRGPRKGVFVAMQRASSAIASMPTPWMRLAVRVKYSSTNGAVQPDGFEDLRAAIALLRRDAHLRHHLQQAFDGGLDVRLVELVERVGLRDIALVAQRVERGERQVRIDRAGAVAGQQGEVLHFARLARLDDQSAAGARFFAKQMMMHAAGGQQRGNGDDARRRRRGPRESSSVTPSAIAAEASCRRASIRCCIPAGACRAREEHATACGCCRPGWSRARICCQFLVGDDRVDRAAAGGTARAFRPAGFLRSRSW